MSLSRESSPKPRSNRSSSRERSESPYATHRRTSSDTAQRKLSANSNFAYLEGEDMEEMSPLKRLQHLKQNGSLRLTPPGGKSRRNINIPADVRTNLSGSDSSLGTSSDAGSRTGSRAGSRSDVSIGSLTRKPPSGRKDYKNVRFEDNNGNHGSHGSHGNLSNSSDTSRASHDSNGNLGSDCNQNHNNSLLVQASPPENTEIVQTAVGTQDVMPSPEKIGQDVMSFLGSSGEAVMSFLGTEPQEMMSSGVDSQEVESLAGSEGTASNDVDSETGEVRASIPTAEVKPVVRDIPASVPYQNNPRIEDTYITVKHRPVAPVKPTMKAPVEHVQTSSHDQSHGTIILPHGQPSIKQAKQDKPVTVQFAPLHKPIINVKLCHRDSKSQTPSPSMQRSMNRNEKWLSKSVDELDSWASDTQTDNSMDIYACYPTSFVRDSNLSVRNSFMDKDRCSVKHDDSVTINERSSLDKEKHSFLNKDRDESVYNSIGDVQTLLRNSLIEKEEKIYSLPQPACYGDNTLKAVKKITEKYDTLQRRKMRALSFSDHKGVPGSSHSQPASPVSPGGEQVPSLPSSPPPPLTLSVIGSLSPLSPMSLSPDLDLPPPPLSAGLNTTISSIDSSVFEFPDGSVLQSPTGSCRSDRDSMRSPPPPPPRQTSPQPSLSSRSRSSTLTSRSSTLTSRSSTLNSRSSTLTSTSTLVGEADMDMMGSYRVSDREVSRIDLFYHGRDTEIYVCRCLADLSFGNAVCSGSEEVSDWGDITSTGVPLFILNTGAGKRKRELLLTLAEKETGFPLWTDKINYLSNYRKAEPNHHVLQQSSNLRKVTGLQFYCSKAADEFIETFKEVTKNPHDDLWKVSSSIRSGDKKKKRSFSFKRSKPKKPSKKEISVPCNFSHVTAVDAHDRKVFDNLSDISGSSRSLPTSPSHSRPVSIANSNHL